MNTVSFGDVVKIHFRGRKQPFKILSATEEIKEGDACTIPLLPSNPLCYDTTLQRFVEKMTEYGWRAANNFMFSAQSIGETPSDEHTARIYIRPIYK